MPGRAVIVSRLLFSPRASLAWAVRVTDQGQDWPIVWSETAPGIAKVYALAQTGLPLHPRWHSTPATWRLVF